MSTKVRTTNNLSERSSVAPDRNSIPQGRQRVKMARPTRWNFWHAFFFPFFFFILHCARCSFSLVPLLFVPTSRRVFSPARLDRFVMRLQSFPSPLSFQPRTGVLPIPMKKKKRHRQINSRVCVLEDRH